LSSDVVEELGAFSIDLGMILAQPELPTKKEGHAMADATYDVIIVGGGNKALVTAIYLAKYGGMKVALFEERHELGGGWGSHEAASPGFISNTHASTVRRWYFLPLYRDFPEIEEKGFKLLHNKVALGFILKEDQSFLPLYHPEEDPSGEKTLQEVRRFASERDLDTWSRVYEMARAEGGYQMASLEETFNLPPPPGQPTPLERWLDNHTQQPDALFDKRFLSLSADQAAREFWDTEGLQYLTLRRSKAVGFPTEVGNSGLEVVRTIAMSLDCCFVRGGTHNAAHVCQRILLEHGGKFFTKNKVQKVLIENGAAKGIVLDDGTEILSKIVVTTVDPYQLCFDLIGSAHLESRLLRKVAHLERSLTCITWYTWALHESPDYRSSDYNPDVNDCQWLILGSRDVDSLIRESHWRRAGKNPPDPHIVNFHHHSLVDPTQAPAGKHVVGTEMHAVPAYSLSEREWIDYKKRHAEDVMTVWQDYMRNIGWSQVIGYDAITPYDTAMRQANMAPAGNWSIIDRVPGQTFPNNPVPELASHRTPIKNLYATGSAWGSYGGGHTGQGYTCYKAIAEDLELRKTWEGQSW
jgi:phytoene dehydrogenase-like protein